MATIGNGGLPPPWLPARKSRNRDSGKNGSFFQDLLINADAQTKLVGPRLGAVLSIMRGSGFIDFFEFSWLLALFSGSPL
jgi:hypothetical protein